MRQFHIISLASLWVIELTLLSKYEGLTSHSSIKNEHYYATNMQNSNAVQGQDV
jgi:hypothetical protein